MASPSASTGQRGVGSRSSAPGKSAFRSSLPSAGSRLRSAGLPLGGRRHVTATTSARYRGSGYRSRADEDIGGLSPESSLAAAERPSVSWLSACLFASIKDGSNPPPKARATRPFESSS
eukprot:CAMPEP_0181228774 /NCGR_PEP_ID=MMETSP1096-20121128/33531_1 /TAXON_ID=156174 ORGANISM="Chrysochromulina ericina, Strain CCMP281" /NCGR_SAMPLE_ID=MMETSP1096 /ASSEMBLY_ACC=CAM_ASM_000453 /LENGTH=118 /DNA_ID=CAMNT_0023322329 /DNA_START=366 /DNA_END=722 /DNA_ORIENTATION=-